MDQRIEQAVSGDRDAVAELLFEQHDRLRRNLDRKLAADLRPVLEVDDLFLQQTFIEVFKSIGGFRPKSDRSFVHWLDRVAENVLLDAVRGLRTQKRGGDVQKVGQADAARSQSFADLFDAVSGGVSSPSHKAAREEGIRALQVQLAALPADYRQAIYLRDIEGKTREEVAAAMGRTPDEVRGLLYRGRKKLRDTLGSSSLYFSKG